MHRKTATTLAALIGLSFATGLQATIDPTSVSIIPDNNALEHEHVSDRVFVRFKDPDALDSRIAVMDGIGGRIASSSKLVPGLHCIEIDVSVEEALRFLSQQGNTILYAEPVYIVRTMDTVPNDPFYNNLYGMPQINAPQADDHRATRSSGSRSSAPASTTTTPTSPPTCGSTRARSPAAARTTTATATWTTSTNTTSPTTIPIPDVNGHARTAPEPSVEWQQRHRGQASTGAPPRGPVHRQQWNGFHRCRHQRGRVLPAVNQIKVSNNSWEAGDTPRHCSAVERPATTSVTSSSPPPATTIRQRSYPGAMTCNNLICVAATDGNENLAGFSQYNAVEVDLGAPGVDVLGDSNNNYSSYSGTSMATPRRRRRGTGVLPHGQRIRGRGQGPDHVHDACHPSAGRCVTGGVLDVETQVRPSSDRRSPCSRRCPRKSTPEGLTVLVRIDPREDVLVGGSVKVRYRANGGLWTQIDMSQAGPGNWSATIPAMECDDSPEFYITGQGQTAGQFDFPAGGASDPYKLLVGNLLVAYEDNGQTNGNWTVSSTSTDGQWNRGVPVNCGRGDPTSDADGSGSCWLTDNSSSDSCNSDVDNGSTTLTSGVIALDGIDAPVLSYSRWFHNSYGDNSNTDTLDVEYSVNGVVWNTLETVGPAGSEVNGGWIRVSWDLQDIIGNATQIQIRFTASAWEPTPSRWSKPVSTI